MKSLKNILVENHDQMLHEKLMKHYDHGYSEDHMNALNYYTDAGYHNINSHLHGSSPISSKPEDDEMENRKDLFETHEPELSSAMKVHKTPFDITFHSGLKMSPFMAGHDPIKRQHAGYLSTALHQGLAANFAPSKVYHGDDQTTRHVLKLHIPQGSHGIYVPKYSAAPNEREFIIHKGAKFHIHPEPEIKKAGWNNGVNHTKVWNAHLVHDGIKAVGGK